MQSTILFASMSSSCPEFPSQSGMHLRHPACKARAVPLIFLTQWKFKVCCFLPPAGSHPSSFRNVHCCHGVLWLRKQQGNQAPLARCCKYFRFWGGQWHHCMCNSLVRKPVSTTVSQTMVGAKYHGLEVLTFLNIQEARFAAASLLFLSCSCSTS